SDLLSLAAIKSGSGFVPPAPYVMTSRDWEVARKPRRAHTFLALARIVLLRRGGTTMKATANRPPQRQLLPKAPTGIQGLDQVTFGGLPRGRPTLICGSAGSGKTLLAAEFLVRGAIQYGEPGVFVAFEETAEELTQNVRSLGFDLEQLIAQKK